MPIYPSGIIHMLNVCISVLWFSPNVKYLYIASSHFNFPGFWAFLNFHFLKTEIVVKKRKIVKVEPRI